MISLREYSNYTIATSAGGLGAYFAYIDYASGALALGFVFGFFLSCGFEDGKLAELERRTVELERQARTLNL